jgi:hypothetical protein
MYLRERIHASGVRLEFRDQRHLPGLLFYLVTQFISMMRPGLMVTLFSFSTDDRGFDQRSGEGKDHKMSR